MPKISRPQPSTAPQSNPDSRLDLQPAHWIWYPSSRCLPNTFIYFRKEFELKALPRKARGWISADSRYCFYLNGQRREWGPPPCDPRYLEADPLELTPWLKVGKNVLAAQVLYYGHGDGTWPLGKPGFIFWLELEFGAGAKLLLVSDSSWSTHLARAWPPGHYKRWYVRALQEEFDARLDQTGWQEIDFQLNQDWLPALELNARADKPPLYSTFNEYTLEIHADPRDGELRRRSIPLLNEFFVPVKGLIEAYWIQWLRPPVEYFECLPPDAFQIDTDPVNVMYSATGSQIQLNGKRGLALTFEFPEQLVGWPYFVIEAPEGTVIELLVHEAHQPGGAVLLNTHFHAWTRFTCTAGLNRFETFDYESFRWLQLHLHATTGTVTIKAVGARRRIFPWPETPNLSCSDPVLQQLLNASINTLNNSAQETLVDGMARERQQYSGDVGHQMHAIYYTFGETSLLARYLTTFSQGQTPEGYFLDCWPAYDRLARLMERQLHLTPWGPLLDHGVGFIFDCFYYYLYTGDRQTLHEIFPRLVRFYDYLKKLRRTNGLLPVENLGVPSVWLDHNAYQQPRHKQCAFNLYVAAMADFALGPLCHVAGNSRLARQVFQFGQQVLAATQKHFWSTSKQLFINNLPWLAEEKEIRLCDRSLATAILFDQCPENQITAAIAALCTCPPEMGFSYPANAGWRLWALAKVARIDMVLNDFRTRWAQMSSVQLNNTLQEDWHALPDSAAEWSHCAVAPLYLFYMNILGLTPLEPGFKRFLIRPQIGDLEQVEATAHTCAGPFYFRSQGPYGARQLLIQWPVQVDGVLVVDQREVVALPEFQLPLANGTKAYQLPEKGEIGLNLKYT